LWTTIISEQVFSSAAQVITFLNSIVRSLLSVSVDVEKQVSADTAFSDNSDVVTWIVLRVLQDFLRRRGLMVVPVPHHTRFRFRMDWGYTETT